MIKEIIQKLKNRKYMSKTRKIKWTIQNFLEEKEILYLCYITRINVNHFTKSVTIHSYRPGIIIGKRGCVIDELKNRLLQDNNIKNVYLKDNRILLKNKI